MTEGFEEIENPSRAYVHLPKSGQQIVIHTGGAAFVCKVQSSSLKGALEQLIVNGGVVSHSMTFEVIQAYLDPESAKQIKDNEIRDNGGRVRKINL